MGMHSHTIKLCCPPLFSFQMAMVWWFWLWISELDGWHDIPSVLFGRLCFCEFLFILRASRLPIWQHCHRATSDCVAHQLNMFVTFSFVWTGLLDCLLGPKKNGEEDARKSLFFAFSHYKFSQAVERGKKNTLLCTCSLGVTIDQRASTWKHSSGTWYLVKSLPSSSLGECLLESALRDTSSMLVEDFAFQIIPKIVESIESKGVKKNINDNLISER